MNRIELYAIIRCENLLDRLEAFCHDYISFFYPY